MRHTLSRAYGGTAFEETLDRDLSDSNVSMLTDMRCDMVVGGLAVNGWWADILEKL